MVTFPTSRGRQRVNPAIGSFWTPQLPHPAPMPHQGMYYHHPHPVHPLHHINYQHHPGVPPQQYWHPPPQQQHQTQHPRARKATTPSGKPSKAQPRPEVVYEARGIGPIKEPNENDVLCGRGGKINSHNGNIQFRKIINKHKEKYLAESTKKLEKAHIAAELVRLVRNMTPPGRFLKEDWDGGPWYDIGDVKALKKVGQALREEAPKIRKELPATDANSDDNDDDGTDKDDKREGKKHASTDDEDSEKQKDDDLGGKEKENPKQSKEEESPCLAKVSGHTNTPVAENKKIPPSEASVKSLASTSLATSNAKNSNLNTDKPLSRKAKTKNPNTSKPNKNNPGPTVNTNRPPYPTGPVAQPQHPWMHQTYQRGYPNMVPPRQVQIPPPYAPHPSMAQQTMLPVLSAPQPPPPPHHMHPNTNVLINPMPPHGIRSSSVPMHQPEYLPPQQRQYPEAPLHPGATHPGAPLKPSDPNVHPPAATSCSSITKQKKTGNKHKENMMKLFGREFYPAAEVPKGPQDAAFEALSKGSAISGVTGSAISGLTDGTYSGGLPSETIPEQPQHQQQQTMGWTTIALDVPRDYSTVVDNPDNAIISSFATYQCPGPDSAATIDTDTTPLHASPPMHEDSCMTKRHTRSFSDSLLQDDISCGEISQQWAKEIIKENRYGMQSDNDMNSLIRDEMTLGSGSCFSYRNRGDDMSLESNNNNSKLAHDDYQSYYSNNRKKSSHISRRTIRSQQRVNGFSQHSAAGGDASVYSAMSISEISQDVASLSIYSFNSVPSNPGCLDALDLADGRI